VPFVQRIDKSTAILSSIIERLQTQRGKRTLGEKVQRAWKDIEIKKDLERELKEFKEREAKTEEAVREFKENLAAQASRSESERSAK
jgi:hypothetical protein